MTILRVMRTLGSATVHGFRSSFRDWASEETNFQNDVIEAALAHVNPNATERAYKRTTFFEKRRKLMEAWASYLDGAPANVVQLPLRDDGRTAPPQGTRATARGGRSERAASIAHGRPARACGPEGAAGERGRSRSLPKSAFPSREPNGAGDGRGAPDPT